MKKKKNQVAMAESKPKPDSNAVVGPLESCA